MIFPFRVIADKKAGRFQLKSSDAQTNLLELFSSEGCSSCPPAEAWLSSLRRHPLLWKRFVPVEFHVDYWNRLGWTDRFSRSQFTNRQRIYANLWGRESMATPGFVVNGSQWRMGQTDIASTSGESAGILTVEQGEDGRYRAIFKPSHSGLSWDIHGCLLGNGLVSKVTTGENAGRTLRHEFVVLSFVETPMKEEGGVHVATFGFDVSTQIHSGEKSQSVAFWVTPHESLKVVQAVGGDLNSKGGTGGKN